jgi:hypothetical protein
LDGYNQCGREQLIGKRLFLSARMKVPSNGFLPNSAEGRYLYPKSISLIHVGVISVLLFVGLIFMATSLYLSLCFVFPGED